MTILTADDERGFLDTGEDSDAFGSLKKPFRNSSVRSGHGLTNRLFRSADPLGLSVPIVLMGFPMSQEGRREETRDGD